MPLIGLSALPLGVRFVVWAAYQVVNRRPRLGQTVLTILLANTWEALKVNTARSYLYSGLVVLEPGGFRIEDLPIFKGPNTRFSWGLFWELPTRCCQFISCLGTAAAAEVQQRPTAGQFRAEEGLGWWLWLESGHSGSTTNLIAIRCLGWWLRLESGHSGSTTDQGCYSVRGRRSGFPAAVHCFVIKFAECGAVWAFRLPLLAEIRLQARYSLDFRLA
jgi:hypothetical protein